MDSELLERYSRNIILREIGGMGQKRLSQSKVLMIGVGGLGIPALMYLAASGVGKIGLVDFDTVSLSNLQRQVLFKVSDIGRRKVDVVSLHLKSLNPSIEIVKFSSKLTKHNVEKILVDYDLILDGTDNFQTRYLINKFCVLKKKALLFAAISQWDGQMGLYEPRKKSTCFECLFPEKKNNQFVNSCSENGVLGPLVGIMGSLMACEAVKFVTNSGTLLTNEILLYEALSGHMRRYRTRPRIDCKVCG